MGVATHLGINLREYDNRIRTFIPDYEEMLDVAAAIVPSGAKTIVDLGVGTGALAWRCLNQAKRAHVVGIDADSEIMRLAARRLGRNATLVCDSFLRASIPRSDAVVASLALHHVRTPSAKARLYKRVRAALPVTGVFVTVDCHPAKDTRLAREQREAWAAHLRKSYSRKQAAEFLAAWAREDSYMPLDSEIKLMEQNRFRVEILWRKQCFAVLLAK